MFLFMQESYEVSPRWSLKALLSYRKHHHHTQVVVSRCSHKTYLAYNFVMSPLAVIRSSTVTGGMEELCSSIVQYVSCYFLVFTHLILEFLRSHIPYQNCKYFSICDVNGIFHNE